jgi:hypothetical protein
LHCIALHCIALHCIALHCIALHCIALHCIALHCIALHCIAQTSLVYLCCKAKTGGKNLYIVKGPLQSVPPKKGELMPLSWNAQTTKVARWFLYINVTLLHKNKLVWDQGCEWGAGFVPFSCQKGGMGVEMRVQVSPILLFPNRFRVKLYPSKVKPYPLKQEKGGVKVCPWRTQCVGLFAGQNGAFMETLETRSLATTWVSGVLQYAPQGFPVGYYCLKCWVGLWWAVTAKTFNCHLLSTFAVNLFQGDNKQNRCCPAPIKVHF